MKHGVTISIFTDGSSRGNPGPGGWGAIVSDGSRTAEVGGREAHTTNNRMELAAAIGALRLARSFESVEGASLVIHADSSYVVNGITKWVRGWKAKGWKTAGKQDVSNRDLWEALDREAEGLRIEWKRVEGHAGVPANERCDEIATAFADGGSPAVYDGPAAGYSIDMKTTVPSAEGAASKAASKRSKSGGSGPAYAYLSMVNGEIMFHKTWSECEARVKGVSAAKFKKALSPEDAQAIIKEWLAR